MLALPLALSLPLLLVATAYTVATPSPRAPTLARPVSVSVSIARSRDVAGLARCSHHRPWRRFVQPGRSPLLLRSLSGKKAEDPERLPALASGRRRLERLRPRATDVSQESLQELLESQNGVRERYIFCGGKGGVGKTTTAAAIGVKLAEEGHRTLVVSTDPAHSLGDAYAEDISEGIPVDVGGPLAIPLYAMEIDAEKSLKKFSEVVQGLDLIGLAEEAGISIDMLETVGASDVLKELSALFENPPPGIDEIVAISQVVKLLKSGKAGPDQQFDRVVFDTAPTGHTLRLLALPKFLDGFVARTLRLRARLGGVLNSLTTMLGMENTFDSKLNKVVDSLEDFQKDIQELKALFENSDATEFIVVTIPTVMAVKESERLLGSLKRSKIATKHIIVNKLLAPREDNSYLDAIKEGQGMCLDRLRALESSGVTITEVPYFDTEVTGVPALQHMSGVAFAKGWEELDVFTDGTGSAELSIEEKLRRMEAEIEREATGDEPRFIIMGGKGGVGKTSCSSALAVHLASKGAKVAVVSTDPAHSLGDSLQMDLTGSLQPVNLVSPESTSGELYALEVDTEGAIKDFKNAVQEMVGKREAKKVAGEGGMDILGQLKLEEFAETLETPPPGADELVALSEVLKIVAKGTPGSGEKFDYVVIDTAPTGHTLRLLALPEFLDKFFQRLRKIRDKVGGATSFLNMFMGSESSSTYGDSLDAKYGIPDIPETPVDRLQSIQENMHKVTNLLKNHDQSQFCIVTIPTVLAVAETERLVKALQEQDIKVSHVIANQIIGSGGEADNAYLERISQEQDIMMNQVNSIAESGNLNVIKVPFFDAEVRSVYGLKILGDALFSPQKSK